MTPCTADIRLTLLHKQVGYMFMLELYLKFSEQSEAKSVAFCMDLLTALAADKVCKAF